MRNALLAVCLIVLLSPHSSATNFQARLLLHKQEVASENHFGISGWFVVPDISTAKPLRNLLVVGPCYKDSTMWVELMAGCFITGSTPGNDSTQPTEFAFNLRMQRQRIFTCDLYAELLYRTSDPVIPINVTRKMFSPCHGIIISAGPEFDWFLKKRDFRVGPRITIKYEKFASFSLAYQFTQNEDILRMYCLLNL